MAVSCSSFLPSASTHTFFGLSVIVPLFLTHFPPLMPQRAFVTCDHHTHTCVSSLWFCFALCFWVLLRSTDHARPGPAHLIFRWDPGHSLLLFLWHLVLHSCLGPPPISKGIAGVGGTEADHSLAPNVQMPKCFIQQQTRCFLLCREPLGSHSEAPGFCSAPTGCTLKKKKKKEPAFYTVTSMPFPECFLVLSCVC